MYRNTRDEQTNRIEINGNGREYRRNEVRSRKKTATYLRSTTLQIALKMKMKIRKKKWEQGASNKPPNYEYKIINKHLCYFKWGARKRNIVFVSLSKWFFMWCGFTVMLLCIEKKRRFVLLSVDFLFMVGVKRWKNVLKHANTNATVRCTICSGLD